MLSGVLLAVYASMISAMLARSATLAQDEIAKSADFRTAGGTVERDTGSSSTENTTSTAAVVSTDSDRTLGQVTDCNSMCGLSGNHSQSEPPLIRTHPDTILLLHVSSADVASIHCSCALDLFRLQVCSVTGSSSGAVVTRSILYRANTLDLRVVLPGHYALCVSCAGSCTAEPTGFRIQQSAAKGSMSATGSPASAALNADAAPAALVKRTIVLRLLPPAPADSSSTDASADQAMPNTDTQSPPPAVLQTALWLLRATVLAASLLLTTRRFQSCISKVRHSSNLMTDSLQ